MFFSGKQFGDAAAMAHELSRTMSELVDYRRKRQTFAATQAEPGGPPLGVGATDGQRDSIENALGRWKLTPRQMSAALPK
jgi:hypothetical protein